MDCMKELNANYTKREFKMDALLTDFEFDSIKNKQAILDLLAVTHQSGYKNI